MDEKQASSISRSSTLRQGAMVADGFNYQGGLANKADSRSSSLLDLGASDEAPPAYGELHDQFNLSQAGFNAGAAVTDDGRVNINIQQTNHQLSDLLAPALRGQLLPSQKVPQGPLPPAYIPPSLGGQPGQTPPPKLNLVIQIVGSRGDVQPFVALGKVLKDTYGHRVRVATHPVFQPFVEENGLEFFSIGGDPAELMAFMVKNPGLMPGLDALKTGEVAKRRKGIEQIVLGCWRSCIEAGDGLGPPPETTAQPEPLDRDSGELNLPGNPDGAPFVADAIIANPPSFAHIHIAEKMGIPLHMMFTMPWSPTRAFPHPLANIESSNTDVVMTNYVSYALVEMMTWQGLGDVINRFRTKVLDLEPLSLIWAPGLLTRLHIPTTYCWSPALIPKPNDWGREINIPGFYFLDLATSYTPEPDLAAFLEAGPPPVYIGFGSIVVDDPNKLTRMIFDAVTLSGVRALVSKGWGGLGADSVGIPEGVFMLGNCPHDWLFKKVSCVVHHGGAGTTAAGIKTGTPTVVVPFFGDQPFWGSMIAKAGAGPNPIPYTKLTAESLAEAITTALKPETQARAKELGEKIRQEKGTDLGAKSFHDFLDYDKMRCSIAPSRTAVWRIRRTKVRMSAMAAAVLVREGALQYSDLKLYRAQEYDTEEQPWDPISAVTSALVGDMSSMAMAIGDIPKEWYKVAKKSPSQTPSQEQSSAPGMQDAASVATQDTSISSDKASTSQPSIMLSPPVTSSSATSFLPGDNSTTSRLQAQQSLARPSSPSSTGSGSHSPSNKRADSSSSAQQQQGGFNVEAAIGASLETGKGVGRLVEAGVKSPMNFCMGLAKGFRNAPRLYNDETVRKQEKVTGLASGVMLAGKEFGLGLYDGITGLVTQPYKGAEKEGMSGLIKGIGKGIGGIVLKPQAGFWAIPAYTMKGVHAEVRAKFHRSVENYIVASRILQGQNDLLHASSEEQNDVLVRFLAMREGIKGLMKAKQPAAGPSASSTSVGDGRTASPGEINPEDIPDSPPKTGFWHTRNLSLEERKRLHALKDAWKRKKTSEKAAASAPGAVPTKGEQGDDIDEEMERAIRESVAQTSTGDSAEDAQIEAQMRASVREMRRAYAEEQRQGDARSPAPPALVSDLKTPAVSGSNVPASGGQIGHDITDEEYEALVAEAVRQSLLGQQQQQYGGDKGLVGGEEHGVLGRGSQEDEDEHLRKALEESRRAAATAGGGSTATEDDAELKRALEESERAHRENAARERSEEEIVMEYVKKQSLAEEKLRRERGGGGQVSEEDDEELRRAMEESLRVSGREGGPSKFS